VRSVNWSPTPVYSAADFKRDSALQAGKLPTPEAVKKTEDAIRAAYHAQGYLEADVTSSYKLNPLNADTGAIDYTFSVESGPVYHLRTLTVHGLGPQAQKDFDAAWSIQPGDAYNEDYLFNFLKNHTGIASLTGYVFDYNRHTTTDTHEVDLTLNFKPAP
jgi:outer membrane protein assembly factor BamA